MSLLRTFKNAYPYYSHKLAWKLARVSFACFQRKSSRKAEETSQGKALHTFLLAQWLSSCTAAKLCLQPGVQSQVVSSKLTQPPILLRLVKGVSSWLGWGQCGACIMNV